MRTVIYLPFVLSVLLVGLSRVARRRAAPRAASWALLVAMVVLSAAVVAALALLAWPLWARIPAVAQLGHWRPSAVNQRDPVPLAVSVAATVALLAQAAALVIRLCGLRGEVLEAAALHAALSRAEGGDVTVVDDPAPSAVALPGVPGHRGRVVVSTGLLAVLDEEERVSVMAHERAHLRHHHGVFAAVAAVGSAINPIVRPVGRDVDFLLERWADADAAASTGPSVTAHAIARAAVARLSMAGSGFLPGRQVAAVGVAARVAALLDVDDRPATGRLLWAVAAVALVALVAVAWATHDTERLFEALQAS